MSAIARIDPRLILLLAAGLYMPTAWMIAAGPGPEADLVTYWSGLLTGLLVVEALTGWVLIEVRFGRLLPPIDQSRPVKTVAQVRNERRATAILCAIAVLTGAAPPAVSALQGDAVGAIDLVPVLIWAWHLRFFGLARMRHGAIMLLVSGDHVESGEDAHLFLTGAALQFAREVEPSAERIRVSVRPESEGLVPHPAFSMRVTGPEVGISYDAQDNPRRGLMCCLTGDANPYKLIWMKPLTFSVVPGELSAHERMDALKAYNEGLDAAARIKAAPA